MSPASEIVTRFGLIPHPEGGYYKETYRSAETVLHTGLPERFTGDRAFSTAIYFLLEKGNFSAFHKIKSDECWHFYAGQTLLIHIVHLNGKLETIQLGSDWMRGETFQYVVPANCWFASEPAQYTDYAFTGCTVAPGFEFADFSFLRDDTTLSQRLRTVRPEWIDLL